MTLGDLLPLATILVIGGGIIFVLQNKEEIYAELKKWWKNRKKTHETHE